MITVTKKDLIELGYGTSFAADIIREAKRLMISKGHTYYQSRKLDRVPRVKSWQKTLLRRQKTEPIILEQT